MAWAYEGHEGHVAIRATSKHRPIYRAWKDGHGHFYTIDRRQYDALDRSYSREGKLGFVAKTDLPGHTPLYHLYDPETQDHFFTISWAIRNEKRRAGYENRGRVGYVAEKRSEGHQPFYRAYSPEMQDHLYTADVSEVDEYGPKVSSAKLERLIRKAIKKYSYFCRIYMSDDQYYCPSEAVAKRIMDEARTAQREYMEEIFDCDDFAHLLKSAFIENVYDSGSRSVPYAVGVISGYEPYHHAMNMVVTSDGSDYAVKIIEPQEAKLYNPKKSVLDEIYLMIF
jgi:hypothetical protein